jgi:hypothetical protein
MFLFVLFTACASGGRPHLTLRVDSADGGQGTYSLPGEGWRYDSLLVPFMSWPDAAEWESDTEVGTSLQFIPGGCRAYRGDKRR